MVIANKIQLKICGMREVQNIMDVASVRPEYMGFIFYAKSPRYVGEEFVIPAGFPDTVKRVGVFVNESTTNMMNAVKKYRLEYVQLHGNESVQQCEELKKENIGLIKAFSVDDTIDLKTTRPYQGIVDFFLFDTKGKYFGGNAMTFNWAILGDYNQRTPFFLSGGINSDNIASVKELGDMNLHAIDVNSGVEISPALKSIEKVNEVKRILNTVV